MRVFHLKTTSLRGRQNVYGYILVSFSFLVLTFLTVKTLDPEIRTEAATQTASQTVGPYTMSMSASDTASINITPTATQAVYTGTNNLTVSNTCDSGATITMKMSGTSNALTRTATNGDSLTKTINATNITGALADNSWGYSTNSGSTYAAVPISSATPTTIYNGTTTASNASVPLMFGVKTDNNMPSGTYTGDVVYTMTPKEGCNSYSINWDYAGGTKNSSYNYPTSLSWGATVNLTGSTPTRSGYTFTGWSNGSSNFTGDETDAKLNTLNAKTVTVTAQWKQNCTTNCTELDLNVNESMGYDYQGKVVGVTLKKAGKYKLEVWGAQGGAGGSSTAYDNGGYGGYSYGTISALTNDVLYVAVGQKGLTTPNTSYTGTASAWNGGGSYSNVLHNGRYRATGGGATHISMYNCGELKDCSSYKADILIVAGGGGGTGDSANTSTIGSRTERGGSGGGWQGGHGLNYNNGLITDSDSRVGRGGSQTAGGIAPNNKTGWSSSATTLPGNFGIGGYPGPSSTCSSGGGGGWYGGSGSTCDAGAGGGSGYLNTSKLVSGTYHMYCYAPNDNYSEAKENTYGYCGTSSSNNSYGTTSTGAHVANTANTGNGYARITYLGTSI